MSAEITLTVVVSGVPEPVKVDEHAKVKHLMEKALKETGIEKPDLAEWALRLKSGGEPISPQSTITAAGIENGMTLFLDPDEGGGGEAAAPPAAAPAPAAPVLVDPAISAAKLARELEQWHANAGVYRERGCILLDSGELHAEVAFTCRLPIGECQDLVAVPLAVRFDFTNYDVWPPSVVLIDPVTRRPLEVERIGAVDFTRLDEAGNPEGAFIRVHPETKRVFLCKRGVREYHSHFEHSGDDWLLYRGQGIGTLGQLCEVIWRLSTRNVTGLQFLSRRFEADGVTFNSPTVLEIRQENIDVVVAQVPPEVRAQLQAALAQAQAHGQG